MTKNPSIAGDCHPAGGGALLMPIALVLESVPWIIPWKSAVLASTVRVS